MNSRRPVSRDILEARATYRGAGRKHSIRRKGSPHIVLVFFPTASGGSKRSKYCQTPEVLFLLPAPTPRKITVAPKVPAEVPAAAAAAEFPAAGTARVCMSVVGGCSPAGSPMPMGRGSAMFADDIGVLMCCVWEEVVCWETCWYISEKATDGMVSGS